MKMGKISLDFYFRTFLTAFRADFSLSLQQQQLPYHRLPPRLCCCFNQNSRLKCIILHCSNRRCCASRFDVSIAVRCALFEWWEERMKNCSNSVKRGNRFGAISFWFQKFHTITASHSLLLRASSLIHRFLHVVSIELQKRQQREMVKKERKKKSIKSSEREKSIGASQPIQSVMALRMGSIRWFSPSLSLLCVCAFISSLNGTFNCNLSICPTIWLPFFYITWDFNSFSSKSTSIDSDSRPLRWRNLLLVLHFISLSYAREWRFHQNMKGNKHKSFKNPLAAASFTSNSPLHSPPSTVILKFVISLQRSQEFWSRVSICGTI